MTRKCSRRPKPAPFAAWSELRAVFSFVARRYGLSPAARRTAWDSAKADPAQAYRCYGSIRRSFAVR